ncbi:MAG TPA: efflux transporter outer membrane subunit [Fibrobacteria bacterium]|nr:efflux transporter outer membrane subunit [Fibrobacteria bacterium]
MYLIGLTMRENVSSIPFRARAAAILAAWLALAGCSVGPKFVKPAPPLKKEWSGAAGPWIEVRTRPDSAWWSVFADPVLDSLVRQSYHQNLSLRIVGLRIVEARAQLAVAVGNQFPQVQALLGSAMAARQSENSPNAAVSGGSYLDYRLGFDAAWEADLWGKFRSDVQAQSAQLLATAAEYDNALVSLAAEVARTYAMIRTFEVLLEQAARNIRVQEEGVKIAQARFGAGATSELDVTQSRTLLESTRATVPQLEIGLIQAQNALSTLLGRPTGDLKALLRTSKGIPAAPGTIPVEMPAGLLQRRPDVRNAEFLAIAQNARIGVAKADFYPRFTLFGSIGLQATSGVDGVSANLFDPGSLFYTAGPRLIWPILNYGRIGNNVRVQDARLQQALVHYENTVLIAAREVEDGLAGYLKSREAEASARAAAISAARSVELSLIQYREGAVDYLRVLEAQRSQLEEDNALANAQSAIATNLISLYKALGGGWELRRGQPVLPDSTRKEMQGRTDWGTMLSSPSAPEKSQAPTSKDR